MAKSRKGIVCPKGYKEVICRFIRRNGKIVYPKHAKVFRFFVKK